jgi:hypothetical protein
MTAQKTLLALAAVAAGALLMAQAQQRQLGPANPGPPDKGERFREPRAPLVSPRAAAPLRVQRLEAHELAEGTHSGAPGDLLLTLHGQGFLETAKAPRLEIGEKVLLDDTMANPEGTELYVVLPRQRIRELQALRFREIAVRNPGAREKTEHARATMRATPADLRPPAGAPRARLVFRRGFFVRELVQR